MYGLFLQNLARHISLDASERELVIARLQFAAVKKHALLLKEGEVCRNFYFVNNGCIRMFHTDNEGLDHNIMFCPEDWWASDMASFSGQTPAHYAIAALEDTEVFYFSFTELEQLYIEVPKLERFFRILIQNGFYHYQQRITSNLSKTAEERYQMFRKQYPGLEQRIAQKHIASYLGITPVFLSMIRRKYARGGNRR